MPVFDFDLGSWERLETVPIYASILSWSTRTAGDPANVDITIKDSEDTTVVNDVDMTKVTTGSYFYDYTIPSDAPTGYFYGWIEATGSSGWVNIKTFKFYVKNEVQ